MELKGQHEAFKAKLGEVEPVYKDFTQNYDDIVKIRESNFNGCYKTMFNDDKDEFNEDDNDGVEFQGKTDFNKYLDKVYGKRKDGKDGNIRADQSKDKVEQKDAKDGKEGKYAKDNVQKPVEKKEEKVKVKRTHIMSPEWVKTHGSPFDDNFD